MTDISREILKLNTQFQRVTTTRLPLILGNETVNFTLDNFKLQGFMGYTFQRWLPRKPGWRKDKRPGRAILHLRGDLWRSIKITSLSPDHVAVGSNLKYARAHNEGLRMGFIQSVRQHQRTITGITTIQSIKTRRSSSRRVAIGSQTVSAHTRRINQNIPKRQFLGDSPYLRARLIRAAKLEYMREIRFIKP